MSAIAEGPFSSNWYNAQQGTRAKAAVMIR